MVVGDKVVVDDMGEGMQCSDHPYRRNPGGICAFCLQEKLGKLVSTSKSNPFFPIPPGASSSSPSFRADGGFGDPAAISAASRSKIHFLSASNGISNGNGNSNSNSNNKKKNGSSTNFAYMSGGSRKKAATNMGNSNNLVLKRSKSVAPSTRPVMEGGIMDVAADSPRKKSFWSFLNLSSATGNNQRSPSSSSSGESRDLRQQPYGSSSSSLAVGKEVDGRTPGREQLDVDSLKGSHGASSFGRKVGRSRSVGCGSRSFSGDFLERISTGFGDCTLRRVESHRETKPKIVLHRIAGAGADQNGDEQRFKERIKCGGIFGGFGMISSYSHFAEDYESASTTRSMASDLTREGGTPHGRSRSWSWAFASSRRALRPSTASKPYAIHRDDNPTNVISAVNSTVIVGPPAAAPPLR